MAEGAHMSVLVVDDDDVDRERVLRILQHSTLDFSATEAASGWQALDLVQRQPFDCILLDNHLGDITGAQILPRLQRALQRTCPVIMVTGEGDEQLAVQVLHEGAADYVPKHHLNADVLIRSIRRCLEQQRLRDELAEAHRRLEHHVREQALTIEQRERDLQSILDHMPALIAYWDRALHNRFGNRTHQQWFGIAKERLPGMRMRDVVGEDTLRSAAAYIAGALGGKEQAFDYTARERDGTLRHCHAQFIPDHGAEGRVAGFYSLVTDVTLLKDAQARAAELASFCEAVIQSSPVGIAVFEANGRCVLANTALADTVGATVPALLRQNFRQLASWQDSGLLQEAEGTLADGMPRHCEAHATSSFGQEVWLECGLAAIDRQGARRLLLITHDVTLQRQAQAELSDARDAARAAAQAKSSFLANMSHEIRTPMNAIVGLSRLALEDDLPPRAHDFVDKVHSSAVALMGILDDVLDYSKIEAGQLRFESVEFELDSVLQRVSDLFAARCEQKGLEFVFEVAPEVPLRLVGDPLRLSQVLDNLVGNAIKFTEHGTVRLSVALSEPASAASCLLHFAVHDTGVGISPESLFGLFDAFTQADNSITRRFGGSGLGLAICKRLVQQMEGSLSVESTPGQGSNFHFTARMALAPAAPGDAQTPARSLAGLRVLVVDDDPHCRGALAQQLNALRVVAATAADGIAALREVEQAFREGRPYDALLLDWKMPDMDGVQTLRGLHALAGRMQHPLVHVIMMAGELGRQSLLAATADQQPDEILAKPVLRGELARALRLVREGPAAGPSTADVSLVALMRSRASRLKGAHVLLVEDNPVNQLVAVELLKCLDVEVSVAQDGLEALETVRHHRFDAVLMDLHMPQMDGFEATRRIRAMPHGQDLPVIAMSAAVLPEDRAQAAAAGMVDHVAKPIMVEELVDVLVKWLGLR